MTGKFENPVLNAFAWIVLSPFMLIVFILGSIVLWSSGKRWMDEPR
jgi:hypothetical protein